MRDPSEQVTLSDIARRAGVSLATASRALSNAYGVAPATRERVRAIAAEAAYVVSPEASRLASRTNSRVALVVPNIDRWFSGEMVSGLEEVLAAAGMDVLLYHVHNAADRARFFERMPARRKVDGVIAVGFPVSEAERLQLETLGVHIVAAGGQYAAHPFVAIDDRLAGLQAVNHLLHLRHRRIAMIEALVTDLPEWEGRLPRSLAYNDALAGAGIAVDPGLVESVEWGGEEAAEAMSRLLGARHIPTAVYVHSDEMALGALRTLRRAGLRVPEDISVIGIDDHPLAALADLTTVHQPVREQATRAAHLLLALLKGEDVDRAVVLPTTLVVRRTTAPPAEAVRYDGNPGPS